MTTTADTTWAEWAERATDEQLLQAYEIAVAEREVSSADPDRVDEFLALVRQAGILKEAIEKRAEARAGIFRDGRIVTFENIPLSDLGNAHRLVARFGPDIRWCDPWGKWLVWDGRRWRIDDTRAIHRLAKQAVRAIYNEAAAADDDRARKAIVAHALRSESRTRIEAMIELAKSEPGVPILPDELDANAWLLNTESGTVDLRTGEVRNHCREDLITKLAAVRYDPKAACPIFEAFVDKIFGGKWQLIEFVQRAVGYSLTSDIREQVIFIVPGCGSNGKSTLADVLLAMLGDYAQQTPTGSLMVKRGEGISNDLARLKGARLVAAVESDEGRRLSEALVKQLTGGDRIAARFMRAEWFEFKPSKPVIRGTDHAIWRRIRLIPFDVTIPDAQQDKRLPEKLREELPGILNWAIEGCLAWQRDGLGISEEVTAATAAYREEMDVIGGWVTDQCVTGDALRTKASDLYAAYRTWCENAGEKPVSQRKVASLLRERGFTPDKDKHARYWPGIGLVTQKQPVTHGDAVFGMNGHDSSLAGLSETKRHEASSHHEASSDDGWGEL